MKLDYAAAGKVKGQMNWVLFTAEAQPPAHRVRPTPRWENAEKFIFSHGLTQIHPVK